MSNTIIAHGELEIEDCTGKYLMFFRFYGDGTVWSIVPKTEPDYTQYFGSPLPLDYLHIIDDNLFRELFYGWDD